MKQYKDLDLKKIRNEFDLDFAHFTYKRGQCSCCYGPKDMAKQYWKDGIIKDKDYTYLLFKNADNGRGVVNKYDFIDDGVCIEWNFDESLLEPICKELERQLGYEYTIEIPKNRHTTLIVKLNV